MYFYVSLCLWNTLDISLCLWYQVLDLWIMVVVAEKGSGWPCSARKMLSSLPKMCFYSIFWVSTSWAFENSIKFPLPSNKKFAGFKCRRILVICSTATKTLGCKLFCVSSSSSFSGISSFSSTENFSHKWEQGLICYLTGTKCHWFFKDDRGIWWEGELDKPWLVTFLYGIFNILFSFCYSGCFIFNLLVFE